MCRAKPARWCKQVLVYRPEGRLTALDCLAHPFFRSLRLGQHDAPPAAPRIFDYTREEASAPLSNL